MRNVGLERTDLLSCFSQNGALIPLKFSVALEAMSPAEFELVIRRLCTLGCPTEAWIDMRPESNTQLIYCITV